MKTIKYFRTDSRLIITFLICITYQLVFIVNGVFAQAKHADFTAPNSFPLTKSEQLREKVQRIYTSQIGVREKGLNAGAEVEKYLRYVHLPKGNPWCAAFVCWALGEANVRNPRTGWSPGLFSRTRTIFERGKLQGIENGKPIAIGLKIENDWAKREDGKAGSAKPQGLNDLPTFNFQFSTFNSPGTGDVFGLYFPEKRRIAHVGFIDEWKDPWVITVEGNTNILGSREGDGVYRKRRLLRSVYKVARYVN